MLSPILCAMQTLVWLDCHHLRATVLVRYIKDVLQCVSRTKEIANVSNTCGLCCDSVHVVCAAITCMWLPLCEHPGRIALLLRIVIWPKQCCILEMRLGASVPFDKSSEAFWWCASDQEPLHGSMSSYSSP
jgi:hypothetical protein